MDNRILKLELNTALRCVLDLVLPRTCVVCGTQLLPYEKHICLCCLYDLPKTFFSKLEHNPMADKLNHSLQNLNYEPYAYATALFLYDSRSNYKLIPQSLKYGRKMGAGRYFARLLGDTIRGSRLYDDADLVIPVPLYWKRQWKRGYNQAEIIAKTLASRLGIECETRLLLRRRNTSSQTQLSGEEKRTNVSNAFIINKIYYRYMQKKRSKQGAKDVRHILLVDDVFTSGSTTAACYLALRTIFPPNVRISVATLAFVG